MLRMRPGRGRAHLVAGSVRDRSNIGFARYSMGGGTILLRWAVCLLTLMLLHSTALAEKRVALLIGNEAYASVIGRLANPRNDVALLEQALNGLGFEVVTVPDAGLGALHQAINTYARRVEKGGKREVKVIAAYPTHARCVLVTGGRSSSAAAFRTRSTPSEDMPEDKLNRVTNPGKDNFGFPYCHQGNLTDPEFGWGHSCSEFTKPIALLGPHAAALGLKFYTSNGFGTEYRNAIFLARHGSWNRSVKFGGDVVVIKLNGDGTVRSIEPFMTGFIQNNNYVGRPVDVLPMKDGSLLVSDDYNVAVYRVTSTDRAGAAQ